MALTSWPKTPHDWLLPWAIWRFRNKPEPKPVGIPKEVPKYAWEFLQWCAWRRKGALPPRPDIAPKIPTWGWTLLKQLNIAVPLVPPPPPPPPPPTYINSWKLPSPIMWTTWGFRTDSDFRNVEVIGQRMAEAEVRTVALQIGQYEPDVPSRLRAFGFKIVLWGVATSEDARALDEADADGYIPQIEGPWQYISTLANLDAGVGRGLSISTVTTLAGLETFQQRPDGSMSTLEVEELIEAGCTHGWIECYKQDGDGTTHFPISKMMWSAGRRGFPYANPLIGLYWDVPVDTYQPDLAQYGKQVGAYTAETMRPVDWAAFKQLGH